MIIRPVEQGDWEEWLRMRRALWPCCSSQMHGSEMSAYLTEDTTEIAFVAVRPQGSLGGFLEASLRRYAAGCDTSPVGYVEGWYVDADLRQRGIGAQLVEAAEAWARGRGCQEMASDCLLDNEVSLHAHLALGYEETDRLIHFRKALD
jgi:aminoglycoside 6'-N-acetyltransferase I